MGGMCSPGERAREVHKVTSGQEGITSPTIVSKREGGWLTFHKPSGAGAPGKNTKQSLTENKGKKS